jgi:hypothetical protein
MWDGGGVVSRSVKARGFVRETSNCSCQSCSGHRKWNSQTYVVLLSRENQVERGIHE